MKTRRVRLPQFLMALGAISMSSALAGRAATDATSEKFPYTVPFELGDAEFAPGDNITIQQVRGTSDTIGTGETYCVEGTYTLSSRDEARLSFYTTTISPNPTPVGPDQRIRITKGTGSFRLVQTMTEDGYFHVSFYGGGGGSDPNRSDFGGVYFGQGDRVLRNKGWSYLDQKGTGGSSEKAVSASGPNQVLLEYLGSPVEPPANMDAKYTKDGLINAIQLAARNAGITLKTVVIEDSEYPFLVGVVSSGSDFAKLKDQIKKLDGYEYNGSIGSDTCNVFNIVPYRAYPPGTSQRINHRAWLREQVFFDKLNVQSPSANLTDKKNVTITKIYWFSSPNRPQSIPENWDAAQSQDDGHLLVRVDASFDDLKEMYPRLGKKFVLSADRREDIHAQAERGFWGSECYIRIPAGEYVKMEPGIAYALRPLDQDGDFRWTVRDNIRITRMAD